MCVVRIVCETPTCVNENAKEKQPRGAVQSLVPGARVIQVHHGLPRRRVFACMLQIAPLEVGKNVGL